MVGVMAIAAVLLNSCKKPDEPDPQKTAADKLIGLWGVSDSKTPSEDNVYSECFRFGKDGALERYVMTESDFWYDEGTYNYSENSIDPGTQSKSSNGYINFSITEERHFGITNGLTIYVERSTTTQGHLGFTIVEQTDDRIQYKTQSKAGYMHALSSLPANWNPEFSSPEISVSEASFVGVWDLVSLFMNTSEGVDCKYAKSPETRGITLQPDNKTSDCYFWIDYIWSKAVASGTISSDEDIYVNYDDCSWSLGNGVLTLSCSQYKVGHTNSDGSFSSTGSIVPETPIVQNFIIEQLTDYYLIVSSYDYAFKSLAHYAFHKRPEAGSQKSEVKGQKSNGRKYANYKYVKI